VPQLFIWAKKAACFIEIWYAYSRRNQEQATMINLNKFDPEERLKLVTAARVFDPMLTEDLSEEQIDTLIEELRPIRMHIHAIDYGDAPGFRRQNLVYFIDCSTLDFADRLTCTSLQGLLNQSGPLVYLDYGFYDKLSDRTTNEEFIDDELWFGKYRPMVGKQDARNLDYYRSRYKLTIEQISDFRELIRVHRSSFKGAVLWDDALPETISIAMMLSGLDNLIIISPKQAKWAAEIGLPIVEDLRERWQDRLDLYCWALENLFVRCKPGYVACLEPGWAHPEFFDYAIQNKIFTYSLATHRSDPIFRFGQWLLLLLFAGPRGIRNMLFATRLHKVLKNLGRGLMHLTSPETRLATKIQKRVSSNPFPTIFGWHTCRDNELSFMLHLSANDLRLVPSHMASNFSFHSQLPGPDTFQQKSAQSVAYDPAKIYLTFTLSDGDQLMMMNTGELGNWYQPERGQVPFNWETQPLLVELAPALLEKYYATATQADCLVAGPSGAGYTIQPLMENLTAYTQESVRICQQADVRVITSYDCAPPEPVIEKMLYHGSGIEGYLGGYVYFGDSIQKKNQPGIVFVSSVWPPLERIHASAKDVIKGVRAIIDTASPPRFISVHLFAYRTSITDIYEFIQTLDDEKVSVVRGDQFLQLARQHINKKERKDE
jgi:hypothetical protein